MSPENRRNLTMLQEAQKHAKRMRIHWEKLDAQKHARKIAKGLEYQTAK